MPGPEAGRSNDTLVRADGQPRLLDALIRHSSANHRRQTLAWSKRRQSAAERMAVLMVWRNLVKGRREKVRASPTPAMARGMTERAWTVEDVLEARIFASLVKLPRRWQAYHARRVTTRGAGPVPGRARCCEPSRW